MRLELLVGAPAAEHAAPRPYPLVEIESEQTLAFCAARHGCSFLACACTAFSHLIFGAASGSNPLLFVRYARVVPFLFGFLFRALGAEGAVDAAIQPAAL